MRKSRKNSQGRHLRGEKTQTWALKMSGIKESREDCPAKVNRTKNDDSFSHSIDLY